eukprot:g11941.t1
MDMTRGGVQLEGDGLYFRPSKSNTKQVRHDLDAQWIIYQAKLLDPLDLDQWVEIFETSVLKLLSTRPLQSLPKRTRLGVVMSIVGSGSTHFHTPAVLAVLATDWSNEWTSSKLLQETVRQASLSRLRSEWGLSSSSELDVPRKRMADLVFLGAEETVASWRALGLGGSARDAVEKAARELRGKAAQCRGASDRFTETQAETGRLEQGLEGKGKEKEAEEGEESEESEGSRSRNRNRKRRRRIGAFLRLDERVIVRKKGTYGDPDLWWRGAIEACRGDGTYDVRYDKDGEVGHLVRRQDIFSPEESDVPTGMLTPHDTTSARRSPLKRLQKISGASADGVSPLPPCSPVSEEYATPESPSSRTTTEKGDDSFCVTDVYDDSSDEGTCTRFIRRGNRKRRVLHDDECEDIDNNSTTAASDAATATRDRQACQLSLSRFSDDEGESSQPPLLCIDQANRKGAVGTQAGQERTANKEASGRQGGSCDEFHTGETEAEIACREELAHDDVEGRTQGGDGEDDETDKEVVEWTCEAILEEEDVETDEGVEGGKSGARGDRCQPPEEDCDGIQPGKERTAKREASGKQGGSCDDFRPGEGETEAEIACRGELAHGYVEGRTQGGDGEDETDKEVVEWTCGATLEEEDVQKEEEVEGSTSGSRGDRRQPQEDDCEADADGVDNGSGNRGDDVVRSSPSPGTEKPRKNVQQLEPITERTRAQHLEKGNEENNTGISSVVEEERTHSAGAGAGAAQGDFAPPSPVPRMRPMIQDTANEAGRRDEGTRGSVVDGVPVDLQSPGRPANFMRVYGNA